MLSEKSGQFEGKIRLAHAGRAGCWRTQGARSDPMDPSLGFPCACALRRRTAPRAANTRRPALGTGDRRFQLCRPGPSECLDPCWPAVAGNVSGRPGRRDPALIPSTARRLPGIGAGAPASACRQSVAGPGEGPLTAGRVGPGRPALVAALRSRLAARRSGRRRRRFRACPGPEIESD